jgi:hypothetical protein
VKHKHSVCARLNETAHPRVRVSEMSATDNARQRVWDLHTIATWAVHSIVWAKATVAAAQT